MDADGDIIYCGRKDSQIKIQGFRIELSEIEHVAKNFFNGECRVVVIPKYDNGNQCELHLVVEKKQLDKQQMEEYLYSRLPYYMIPKHMHCLEQFPLNTSSKTDRKKIQEMSLIFREVLKRENIVLDNETTAQDVEGWDSLTNMQLINKIEKKFNVRFTFRDIVKLKNVGDICHAILTKTN